MAQKPRERDTIQRFLDLLGGAYRTIAGIEREPDLESPSVPGGAVDGVVRISPDRYVLELSSISAYADERQENPRYNRFHDWLMALLKDRLPADRDYLIGVPVQILLEPGDDQDLVVRVAAAIIVAAPGLNPPTNRLPWPHSVTLTPPGVPFEITLALQRGPGTGTPWIIRRGPPDLHAQMVQQWVDRFHNRGPKLRDAKLAEGCPSLILIEAHNFPLGSGQDYFAAYLEARTLVPPELDPDAVFFILAGSQTYSFKTNGQPPACRFIWPRARVIPEAP